MFDWELGIALHTMKMNQASSRGEVEVSWFFLSCGGNLGIFSSYSGDDPSNLVCSVTSGLLSSYEGHLRNLLKAWQGNTDTSRGEARDPGSLSCCHSDIGIPIRFQQESGIVTFGSIEFRVPLKMSRM